MFSNIFEGSVSLQNVAMAINYSQDCQIPLIMIKMNLFNREISNLDDLIDVICENVLTSNYFIGDEHIVELDVNEIKSHLDKEELEDFEEFINRLF